tara:strand:+ start:626 stop:1291 length:666 start_codon:yes stop_codon:yes gene_type:complete
MKTQYQQHGIAFLAIGLTFLACYSFIDQPLANWLHTHSLALTSRLASFFSHYFKAGTFYALPILVIIYCYFKDQLRSSLCRESLLLCYIFLINAVLCTALKVLLARARPVEYFHHHLYGFHFFKFNSHFWSFPSGHAFVASTFFSFLAISRPHLRGWCILGIVIMCISRMISGAHYLGDVIVGSFLGYWTCKIIITNYQHKLPMILENWIHKHQPLSTETT